MRSVRALLCLSGLLALSGVASADVIDFSSDPAGSTENLGVFEGSLDYDPSQHRLTISITNTSPAANGGFITGLVFRINSSDANAGATLITAPAQFQDLAPFEAAPPFGSFIAGAALGGDWAGGGSPQAGIAVGQTGVFQFNVAAADSASLEALDFIDIPSRAGADMVVRFRGFGNGGSDKVPAVPDEAVPSPSGAALLAAAGLVATRRRRR